MTPPRAVRPSHLRRQFEKQMEWVAAVLSVKPHLTLEVWMVRHATWPTRISVVGHVIVRSAVETWRQQGFRCRLLKVCTSKEDPQ